jgi:hypothetical protein
MNGVAWQTISGCERCDVTIFNPAKATLMRRGPQCAVTIKPKARDMALTQTIGGAVRGTDVTILEKQNTAIEPE